MLFILSGPTAGSYGRQAEREQVERSSAGSFLADFRGLESGLRRLVKELSAVKEGLTPDKELLDAPGLPGTGCERIAAKVPTCQCDGSPGKEEGKSLPFVGTERAKVLVSGEETAG